MRTASTIAILLGITMLWVGPSAAATIYVDKDGRGGSCSDSRDRATARNISTPVCSVPRALAIALDGDTVLVRAGTYTFTSTAFITRSNFTLKAYPGETPVLDFTNARNTDGSDTRGLYIHQGTNVTIEGLEITGAPAEGIQIWSNATRILYNHIHHCGVQGDASGTAQDCIDTDADDVLIEGNRIHDSGSHNVYVTGNRITIRNNLIYGIVAPLGRNARNIKIATGGSGGSGDNVVISHNVLGNYNPPGASYGYNNVVLDPQDVARVGTVTMVNNVMFGSASTPVLVYNDASVVGPVTIRNNIFAGNGGGNCVNVNGSCSGLPSKYTVQGNLSFSGSSSIGFGNLSGFDFSPVSGSPMIDAALPGYADWDYLQRRRPVGPASDIGAHEFGAAVDTMSPAAIRDLR